MANNDVSKNIVDLRKAKLLAESHDEGKNLPVLSGQSNQNVPAKAIKSETALPDKSIASGLPFKMPETDKETDKRITDFVKRKNIKEDDEKEPVNEIIDYPDALFSWTAPEYIYYEKDRKLWGKIIIASAFLLSLVFLFLMKSYLSVILTVLAAATFYILAFRKPRIISFGLAVDGLYIGSKFFSYDTITSFWIFYHPPEIKEIVLRSKKIFMPFTYLPLGDADPNEVRRIMVQYLKESEEQISIFDELARRIGF